jgi:hypothetical protein
MENDFASWAAAIAGKPAPVHVDEPWCGYFKMRDKRGVHANVHVRKRPWVCCAIWRDENGDLKAEFAKSPIPVDRLWPYCAKSPISYELYQYWHSHERWPEEEKAA